MTDQHQEQEKDIAALLQLDNVPYLSLTILYTKLPDLEKSWVNVVAQEGAI